MSSSSRDGRDGADGLVSNAQERSEPEQTRPITFLGELHNIESWGMQAFWDDDYDGGCPCFYGSRTENDKTVNVAGRCWRVSDNAQDLHVWGDHPKLKTVAKTVKRALDAQHWYNPYTIIYEEFK